MHQVLAINFSDVFKSGFLESFASFSIKDSLIGLGVSFLIGLFIFFIYAKSFSGVVYSASFNVSLVLMTMITALIILGVTSNVVLSLGMVGALSIVRFRSAIKEPIDIVFLFWAISEGILCGAGLLPLALLGAPVIGGLLLLFSLRKDHSEPFLLIVRFDDPKAEDKITKTAEKSVRRLRLKSTSVLGEETELILEVRLDRGDKSFVREIGKMPGVSYASLVSYNGNFSA
ncbi:MAG: DUF4956 domain-containing protein [Clostridia bacterium]|nr:DUF4956 domain-containing protein [Clostridia bacterium]